MNRKNLILTILLCFISIFMLGCGQTNNNAFPEGEPIEENSSEAASVDKTNEEVIAEPIPDNLTEEEVISLVEAINPYELKPTLTGKERYDLRKKIYQGLKDNRVNDFGDFIESSEYQLAKVVVDGRYKELIDKKHKRWDAYERNNLYGVDICMDGAKAFTSYQPIIDDLNTVKGLCEYALEHRDVLAIIDARRILTDIRRHLMDVPHFEEGDEIGAYREGYHQLYFKASKTLEGEHNLISNYVGKSICD
ncbi:MAG: hypothetical protein VR72_06750 [Clostridiaceae bacterium BRH_c20a]|nr:MAG: hypothetical protein VR72_06750 [Clostridiaceae bacterium BRH_c20a]